MVDASIPNNGSRCNWVEYALGFILCHLHINLLILTMIVVNTNNFIIPILQQGILFLSCTKVPSG